MKNLINVICVLFCLGSATSILIAQENYLSGIEFSIDQDNFADFLHDSTLVDENYTVALRLGIYGEVANSPFLGLPWVRETVDHFLIDYALFNGDFREENTSHNFVFVVNGFSPQYISDNDDEMSFQNASLDGYRLQLDRPFSSFTGFRSTRRIEGIKRFSHSAIVLDLAINTSFTFGFASWGLAQNIDNLFGSNRPNANLWDREHPEKEYPTGQLMRPFVPLFMYSVSAEAVIWRPIRQVVAQVRPELNLGYYTNIGVGLDLGKVMNVEKHVDNLSYTDTNNPGTLKVNDNFLSIAFSAGIMSRFVLYNAHINGFFSKKNRANYDYGTRRLVLEAYAGMKLQMFKKLEFNFSVNGRTSEFGSVQSNSPIWGTFGMKYLIAEEGAGCYN